MTDTAVRASALQSHEFGATDIACRRCGKRWIVILAAQDTTCQAWRPGSLVEPRQLPPRSELIALRQGGMTMQEIGDRYGVTRQAVDAALHRSGLATRQASADSEYIDPRRPHLSWIRLACEPELRRALVEVAERDAVSLSEVVRRACRRYLGIPEHG